MISAYPAALLTICLLAPAAALASDEVDAQTIVVTARRQSERAIDVPLQVDALSAGAIGAGRIDSLQSLAARVPGLSFEAIWGGANSFPILRGQSQPSVAGDSVGMFVDGVYQANRDALDVEMLDLERIEVIHGPQSALFGHSTFAGLISYVPAAPSERAMVKASIDAGTDRLVGFQAAASGPLSRTLKARLAASWRQMEGTWSDPAVPGRHYGDLRRWAIAGTLATRDSFGPLSLRLSARYGNSRSNQPPFSSLDYARYNCGGRDASSGVWSYFCGPAPVLGPASLSPGIPDSRSWTAQAALHASLDLGGVELRSDTSWYKAHADIYRDFDGSAGGDVYGVCTVGFNCTPPGSLISPVVRLQRVDIVQYHPLTVREFVQELRMASTGDRRLKWMVGATAFRTRQGLRTNFAYGASRGALAANERFASLVLANPQRVGPLTAINAALAADPNAVQIVQNDASEEHRTLALFATADYRLAENVKVRGELRANWERIELDSRLSNFQPSFGTSIGARTFFDVTPRFSLEGRLAHGWLAFVSYARGSRSGGINAVVNLLPAEQTFEPETNWTAEAGLKYAGNGPLHGAGITVYHIDWRNTQIVGLAATPGVTALVTRNTKGIETWGVELSADLRPSRWLGLEAGFSYTHPRFKPGSEDPGSNAFCGLGPGSTVSSFCTMVPSQINPGQLVPDISGKVVLRAAEVSAAGAITVTPQSPAFHGLALRLGATYQDNVFDRAVNGLAYGKRLLLDGRVTLPLGRFGLELWGTNLTNYRYFRVAAGRQPQFYNGIPRPTDLILGDGRRVGLTLRYKD